MSEMFGVLDSCPGLYQGMLRYWLMWRFPQIVHCVQQAPELKFHLCATYQGLRENFLRLFLLPDFLVVGQCGDVLRYEYLQYLHPFGQHWPATNGTPPALGVISAKPDRPIVDGVIQFLTEWLRPLAPSDRLLFAPFTSILGPPTPPASAGQCEDLVRSALANARENGLPGKELSERLREAVAAAEPGAEIPMSSVEGVSDLNPTKLEHGYGRYFIPGARISEPDPTWTPSAILAFEFLMAQRLGAMMIVAGEWSALVPPPRHELKLSIPYIEGLSPQRLMAAIETDAAAFAEFRRTLSSALLDAMDKRGSEAFSRELERIQRDIVNAGIAKLTRTWESLKKQRRARIGEHITKVLAASVGVYVGFDAAALAVLIGGGVMSSLSEYRSQQQERLAIQSEPMYFIWKLGV